MFRPLTVLFVATFISYSGAQQLVSPCPSLFNYDPEGIVGDRWSGTIQLTTESEYSGLWIRTVFDKPFETLESSLGEVVKREPTEFLIRRPGHKVAEGEVLTLRLTVHIPSDSPPPQLLGFRLNGRTVCPENGTIPAPPPPLVSPCPELFQYEPPGAEPDRWYGAVVLRSDKELSGVWLRLILDRPSIQLGNWFGDIKTEDNKEYLIKNRNHRLKPGETTMVRFFVKYNTAEPIPRLVSFRLNAETVCPSPSGQGTTPTTNRPTERPVVPVAPAGVTPDVTNWFNRPSGGNVDRPVFGSDFDPGSRPSFLPARDPVSRHPLISCGVVAAHPRPLITYGETTVEGQWPWHAALYYPKGVDLQYICGASLISLKHVLTAAHCAARRSSNYPVGNDEIEVYLGKYQLRKFTSPHIQNIQAKEIIIHEGYDHHTYSNDIAVIHLAHPAKYTDYVRPVCLWSEPNDINEVVDREGTVVGWGYDETRKVSETLTKAKMPVVPHSKCIWSYPEFFSKFANDHTFCAGYKNGTSVCNGDSGGGLVFPKKDSNPDQPVWQIRGLVSISVALQGEFVCDTKHYAIFTDIAKHQDWLTRAMAR